MMKKLSRSDHLINRFKEFLQTQGILGEGEEYVWLNPTPFSSLVPVADYVLNKVHFYHCLATSLCTAEFSDSIVKGSTVQLLDATIMSKAEILYTLKKDVLYVYDLANTIINVVLREKIARMRFLDINLRCRSTDILSTETQRYSGVYAVSFFGNKPLLTIASTNPVTLELKGKHLVTLYIPNSEMIMMSNNTYIQAFRSTYIQMNMIRLKGRIKNAQPLIEIIDPLTLTPSIEFSNRCVKILLLNPESISYNAMIKVYGYIDEIVIDNIVEFKPKYNIIRLALSRYSSTDVKLCVSTSIPKRSDMVLRLKGLGQLFDSS